MPCSPLPRHVWRSRGLWLTLFVLSLYVIGPLSSLTWRYSENQRAVMMLLTSLASGSLFPLLSYRFSSQREEHYVQLHHWLWLLLSLSGLSFVGLVAVFPNGSLYEFAARAVGFPVGYLIGYAVLYAGRLQSPPPEVRRRNSRQIRRVVIILMALMLILASIAWYRLRDVGSW